MLRGPRRCYGCHYLDPKLMICYKYLKPLYVEHITSCPLWSDEQPEERMEKLSTVQRRNNLNEVYRCGDVGPGGAYHEYLIRSPEQSESTGDLVNTKIKFQKGARKDPAARHGVLDTDLLEIVRDRLACFQAGEFATMENACALHHIEEALMWMNKRVEDRAERQVLGTYNK